jgi:Transmembrane amino acid transporter protein
MKSFFASLAVLGFLATATAVEAFVPSARTPTIPLVTTNIRQQVSFPTINTISKDSNSLRSTATADNAPQPRKTSGGTATIPALIFNLVKGIVGAGVLGLPAGIVAFGNAPSAAIPALVLITFIGILSAYGFSMTDSSSFREAWTASVSSETSWMPSVAVTFKTICALLAYSMILGTTFSSLFAGVGLTISSSTSLLGVTTLVLLPLCLLKNLSSLAPFSLLGSAGMVYTAVAMAIRYFGKAFSPNAAILVAMLSTAYMVSCTGLIIVATAMNDVNKFHVFRYSSCLTSALFSATKLGTFQCPQILH